MDFVKLRIILVVLRVLYAFFYGTEKSTSDEIR